MTGLVRDGIAQKSGAFKGFGCQQTVDSAQ